MKKERPTRLTLSRETLLQLTEEKLRHANGGSTWPGSGNLICSTNKPPSAETGC